MTEEATTTSPADWQYDARFDGGDKGCGDLILDLKLFMREVPGGARVLIVARDPGAYIDLPAWCHVTGHTYVSEAPPYFLIQRRD